MKDLGIVKNKPKNGAVVAAAVSLTANFCLFLLKLLTGILSRSVSMISDAAHSGADTAAAIAVFAGIKMSSQKCDDCHPYGHGKFESITSLFLSCVLFFAAGGIGLTSLKNMISANTEASVGGFAAAVSVLSIISKELLFRYTYKKSRELFSEALLAEAWHHRSDALASVASLFGITMSKLGLPVFDSAMGLLIAVFIIFTAFGIFKDSFRSLVDAAAPIEVQKRILDLLSGTEGVSSVGELLTRRVGAGLYVEISLILPPDITLYEAERRTQSAASRITDEISNVKRCAVRAVTK